MGGLNMAWSCFPAKKPSQKNPGRPTSATTVRSPPLTSAPADRATAGPRPRALDRAIQIQRPKTNRPESTEGKERSAPAFLQKRPHFYPKSTRTPWQYKSNCGLAQVFTRTPLFFPVFEPAVHALCFCTLAFRTKVYLRLGPRFFCRKPPGT